MDSKSTNQNKHIVLILLSFLLLLAVGLVIFVSNSSEQPDNTSSTEQTENLAVVQGGQQMTGKDVRVQFTVPDGWKAHEDSFRIFLVPEDQGLFVDAAGVAWPTEPGDSPTIIIALSTVESEDQRVSSIINPNIPKQQVLLGGKLPAIRSDLSDPIEEKFQTVGDTPDQELVITYSAPEGVVIKDNLRPLQTIENTIIIVE